MATTPLTGDARTAVVIVNHNAGTLLDRCLTAVAAQTRRAARVMVVDNASASVPRDATMRRFPWVEWVCLEANMGFAAANNLAARMADDCEFLALLNPDAFPEPDWLAALLAAAARYPECAAFGSVQRDAAHPDRLDGTGDVYHVSGIAWRRDHRRPATARLCEGGEIFSPCAAAALYRRTAFLDAGGFDEDFFCYFEDVDLGFRLRLRGHTCRHVAEAVVLHVGSATSGRQSAFATYHSHRNLVWTFVKDMPGPLLWLLLPAHLLLTLVTLAVLAARGQGGVAWRAKRDALRGLRPMLAKRRAIQDGRRADSMTLLRQMAWWPSR